MRQILIPLSLLLTVCTADASFAQDIPFVYSVENTGVDCPKPILPDISGLPTIHPLTDPFEWSDGSGRSTKFSDWSHRRPSLRWLMGWALRMNLLALCEPLRHLGSAIRARRGLRKRAVGRRGMGRQGRISLYEISLISPSPSPTRCIARPRFGPPTGPRRYRFYWPEVR